MSSVGQTPRADGPALPQWQFLSLDLRRGAGFGRHRHEEHQLVVVDRGIVGLATPTATWAVPSACGAWLPAAAEHEVIGIADAAVTFAYLRVSPDWRPPAAGAVVTVTPLLRSAVSTLATPGARRGDRRRRLEAVLFDEVTDLQPVQLPVPLPNDPAARLVAATMLADPCDSRTVGELGALAGASGRTLQRRFSEETGLAFRDWRRRARLQRSMVELSAGRSVTATAYTCGFSSVSAFITAFRTEVGTTPAGWARSS